MERFVESYIVENLDEVFPGAKLVERGRVLPGKYQIDLHLVDEGGRSLFVEVKFGRVKRTHAGQILNYYTALSNLQPPIRDWELILVGSDIDPDVQRILDRLGIKFRSLHEVGLSDEVLERGLKELKERKLRLLTPLESNIVSYLEKNRIRIVSLDDVAKRLNLSRGYARAMVHRLEKKQWLERIKAGAYLFIPAEYGYEERYPPMDPLLVGSVLVEPYYYSYSTSNMFYGLTTQIRPNLFIATTKVRRGFRWRDNKYKFVTVSEYKFFGFRKFGVDGVEIHVAEPEKSVIDSLDKSEYSGGLPEVTSVLCNALKRRDFNHRRLVNYAERMHSHSLVQRLGFLIDFLQEGSMVRFPDEDRELLLGLVGKATIYLAPTKTSGKGGEFSRDWKIIQNIGAERLLSEIVAR